METDICPVKHLGMNQRTRGTRLSARRQLSSRQGFHASAHRRQHGRHAGDCSMLPGEEQARQDGQHGDTACRLGLGHVARCGRHRHVRNSKIAEISPFEDSGLYSYYSRCPLYLRPFYQKPEQVASFTPFTRFLNRVLGHYTHKTTRRHDYE